MIPVRNGFLGQVRLRGRLGDMVPVTDKFKSQITEEKPAGVESPSPECVFIGSSARQIVESPAEMLSRQARSEGWRIITTDSTPLASTIYYWACPATAKLPPAPPPAAPPAGPLPEAAPPPAIPTMVSETTMVTEKKPSLLPVAAGVLTVGVLAALIGME